MITANPRRRIACIRVLGVDPAAAGPTGYGIVESDGRRCRMLHYGAFRVAPKRQRECLGAALQDVHALLCRLMDEFSPDVDGRGIGFHRAQHENRACAWPRCAASCCWPPRSMALTVHSYSPREVKASVAGYGHADKRQMQLMVRALLSMTRDTGTCRRRRRAGGCAVPLPGRTSTSPIWSSGSQSAGKISVTSRRIPRRRWP